MEKVSLVFFSSLENDSPSRGRKLNLKLTSLPSGTLFSLENDSPSRGRKRVEFCKNTLAIYGLENDSPSRGRKRFQRI